MEEGEVEGKRVHGVENQFSYDCNTICSLSGGMSVSSTVVKDKFLKLCALLTIRAFEP